MYRNPIIRLIELIMNVANGFGDGKYGVSDVMYYAVTIVVVAIITLSIAALTNLISGVINKTCQTSYREYMVDVGDTCLIGINKDTGEVQRVQGSIARFLKEFAGADYDAKQMNKTVKEYCVYVDRNYGTATSDVEKNIGKDYKKLLAGSLNLR